MSEHVPLAKIFARARGQVQSWRPEYGKQSASRQHVLPQLCIICGTGSHLKSIKGRGQRENSTVAETVDAGECLLSA